jgi:hypothetical protein
MAIDFRTLKSLSEKPANEWTARDLSLFGINVPEPSINPRTGAPFLSERLAVQTPAGRLKINLSFLVRGIEYANDPTTTTSALPVFAEKQINDFSQKIAQIIQDAGGDATPFLASQPIQGSLQNIALRTGDQSFTPIQGVGPLDRTPAPDNTNTPLRPLVAEGLSAPPPPLPVDQAPALTREYYLSKGIPESQLPPAPLAPSQLHSSTGGTTLPAGTTPPPVGNTPIPGIASAAGQPLAGTTMQTNTPQSFLGGVTPGALLPENLPALRGSATGTSSIDPTLRPYLELGLRGAEQLFLQQQPSLYPGQMFVGPSPQTQAALNMQEDIALSRPTSLEAAQESYMRGLGGLGATAGGAFLMGNPYQQAAIEAASRPIQQQFAQTTLPGIASGFSRAGRYGSQAMGTALGSATEATARALGDVGTQIAYGGYEAERGRQQQAMGAQLQAATLAPQIYGQQFLPSQQLAQVGAAREAIAGQPLQEAIQRYQFQQQMPYQQLQGFLSSIYGTPMAASQYAPPAQTNRLASTLGGAALGAGVGQMIGGSFGGFGAPAIGAGLGALGGLLF